MIKSEEQLDIIASAKALTAGQILKIDAFACDSFEGELNLLPDISNMKFPISSCIPTSLLTKELYSDLICRMVSDGYVNIIPHLSYDLVVMWDYLGVSIYGDINAYDHPHSFMGINGWMDYRDVSDRDYPNIVTKEFLEEYLK